MVMIIRGPEKKPEGVVSVTRSGISWVARCWCYMFSRSEGMMLRRIRTSVFIAMDAA